MKIKITYTESEKRQAQEIATQIKHKLEPDAFVTEKNSDTHKPFFHIYLTSRNYRISGKKA